MEGFGEAQQGRRVSTDLKLIVCTAAFTLLVALGVTSPAFADGNGRGTSDGDSATVRASSGQNQPGAQGGGAQKTVSHISGGGATMCTAQDGTYGPITAKPLAGWGIFGAAGPPPPPDQQQYYMIYCGGHFLHLELLTVAQAATISEPGPGIDPVAVAQEAQKRIQPPLPTIHMSPDVSTDQLVGLDTWLWVDGSDLGMKSATVTARPVSVTGTMSATSVTWTMGDGHTVTCQGPGTPYSPGATPTCSYRYAKSSAGQPGSRYKVTATITWSGTYTVAGAPGGGALAPIIRTATTTVRVAEAEAINTPN
jgi:hypothetical protein